jgi:hypothetical protein
MKLWQYALALLVFIAVGVLAVVQHVRVVRAGYRLAALERDRDRLVEQRRRLELRRAREERYDVLAERARRLGIAVPDEAFSEAVRE